jgi:hypothetical protein
MNRKLSVSSQRTLGRSRNRPRLPVRRAGRGRRGRAVPAIEGAQGAAGEGHRRHRLQKSEPVLGDGIAAFKAVCDLDLEGVAAKRLADAYGPRTRCGKILNPGYT